MLLDAVGSLSFILEEASKGQLPPKVTLEAAQTALHLLGNASANISRERRRTAIANMNSRLVGMADDDHLFERAAPNLFGNGFAKKANTSIMYVYPNLPLFMSISLKEKYLPFTNNQTTHRVGHVFSTSNSCMSESPPGWMGFPLNQELGNNFTGPLGPQLCKRIHNKPTEQASPTCPSQGAKLERGNSKSF